MAYYINCISTSTTLKRGIKELIPNMNMRRRMSRVLRIGVSTGVETLSDFDGRVDAIITSTPLGCLADSEKFLKSIIENQEKILNPTPFIQSTFNTIGAQIGLITQNNCYNITYSHRSMSFFSAMLDAILRIDLGQSENILVGGIDENTPTQQNLLKRLKIVDEEYMEGAIFFVLTKEKYDSSIAMVEICSDISNTDNVNYAKVSENKYSSSFLASMFLFSEIVNNISNGKCNSIVLVNDMIENEFFRLKISMI